MTKKSILSLSAAIIVTLSASAAPTEANRIVSIGGDVTEIIFALGEGDRVIARDTTSTIPEAANALPDVGYMRQLNSEGILAQKPDLVITTERAGPPEVLTQIESVNVPMIKINADDDIKSPLIKIEQLGKALGKTQQADQLIKQYQSELDAISTKPLPYKALFLLTFKGMDSQAAGVNTAPDAMFNFLGIQNAASSLERYKTITTEGLIAMQPDVLVLSESGLLRYGSEENVWKIPGIDMTPAGKNRRLIVVDDISFLGFTLATPATLLKARQALEAF